MADRRKQQTRRDKGTGALYQRNSDGRWVGYVTLPNDPRTGKRRRKVVTAKSRTEAAAKLRELRKDLDRAGDLPTSSPTLSKWLATHDDRHLSTLKPRAAGAARSAIRNYIVPPIGNIRLERLNAEHVYKMHDYVIKDLGLSSSTANQAHRVLRKALADAVLHIGLTRNIADIVSPPATAVVQRKALTADQAKALMYAHRKEPLTALRLAVALLTGMRQGECLGLTWGAIDLDREVITVSWQLQNISYVHGCEPVCGKERAISCPDKKFEYPHGQEIHQVRGALHMLRPKSRKGWREIPLAPILTEMLKAYRKEHYQAHEHDLVFLRSDGTPLPPRADADVWKDALEAAKLPHVPLHSARHTTATLLHELGVPEQVRMQILGHASATVTQGYTHISSGEAAAAMGELGKLLAIGEGKVAGK